MNDAERQIDLNVALTARNAARDLNRLADLVDTFDGAILGRDYEGKLMISCADGIKSVPMDAVIRFGQLMLGQE